MKICVYADPHFSQNSSIVRGRGDKYSVRLENLIRSLNWVEVLAWEHNCSAVVCLGDFFDSSVLNCEEVSALKEISWSPLPHFFLTGNHESSVSNLLYSTSDVFSLCNDAMVISTPQQYHMEGTDDVDFCFIPYITEKDRKPLSEYLYGTPKTRIIFSHNDIKGVQYGQFMSTEGFTIEEIEEASDLYLNGHIHHCSYVSPKIINCGNLTGQNFTEDADKFEHCALIVDTDTLNVDFYCNPYAFNFYKLDCTYTDSVDDICHQVLNLKNNSVITLKVREGIVGEVKKMLETFDKGKLVEYKVLIDPEKSPITEDEQQKIGSEDHLKQFENYVLSNIGNSSLIKEELSFVMR